MNPKSPVLDDAAPIVDSIYYSFNCQWLIESVTVAVAVTVTVNRIKANQARQ